MKNRYAFVEICLVWLLIICVAGYAGNAETSQDGEMDISVEATAEETEEKMQEETIETDESAEFSQKRREIPIAFPFYGEEEDHRLVLAVPEEGENAYAVIHYDENGKILQQIFCGKLTEPITFSFDGLAYGSWNDLEIFSAGSDTGLLFIRKDKKFSAEPVGIPRYEECRGTAMLTREEDDKVCKKEIYLLNERRNRTEKARSYKLHKDTGVLTIRDEIGKRYLFEETVRLDQDGKPVNKKYVDALLWDGLPSLFNYEEKAAVNTWIGEEPKTPEEGKIAEIDSYEDMQYVLYGNSGHTEEYESREALLTDFGFENSEPMYRYFDQDGNLQLELYVDEEREQVCGFIYTNRLNSDLESVADIKGFTLCSVPEAEWNGGDPFAFQSVYGTTGEEDENVKDYEESVEYTAFGKPDRFVSRGRVEGWSAEDELQDILRIEYMYREDGTLYYRNYYHSHQVFGTTLQGLYSYYDAHERVIFASGYITHGWLEFYYIYEDRDEKIADRPTYILKIDHNMGYAVPNMVKCQ